MSISILIISHENIGSSLIDAAQQIIGGDNTLKIAALDADIDLNAN